MRLYLIRHAESANNEIYQGTENVEGRMVDPEITEVGYRQAELVGKHLAQEGNEPRQHPFHIDQKSHYGLTHIYCSLMMRSIITAQYIAKACQIKPEAVSDIYERKGLYDIDGQGNEVGVKGPPREYFEQRFPDLALPDSLNHVGWFDRPVESDSYFIERVMQSLDSIQQRHAGTNDIVAMVVHGDYIDQCINALMEVDRRPVNYRVPL